MVTMDNEHSDPTLEAGPEAEIETTSRPLPIQGMDQMWRQRQTSMGVLRPRPSEESIRTDLCEGLLRDESKSGSPEPDLCLTTTSDRAELIERLKRGESPTWVPSRRYESFVPRKGARDHSPTPRPKSRGSPGLLTASLTKANNEADTQQIQEADIAERMHQGLNIERPRSALHSGDFTQDASSRYIAQSKPERTIPDTDVFNSDLQSSWYATSPPRDFTPFKFERRVPFPDLPEGYKSSPPSLSSSLSSSFVYKHPTSPLVQSESNDDLNINAMDLDPSTPSRAPRRQTLHAFSRSIPAAAAQRIPSIRRQTTFPYQAHQPRKSLTSAPAFSLTGSPPASFAGSRRPSVVLDSSPLQQTSMVGSYEESILRGRMSTTPSKPLDFMAQIGVLGLGNCKPSLKCPAHVTLPFPAVFYSYASTPHGRSTSDDGPSPYVGQVDLENGLPNPEESRTRQKSRQRASSVARSRQSSIGPDTEMSGVVNAPPHARNVAKHRRRHGTTSSKAPPGGSYRIPEKGQIQIIIKNQNKTAVKLFLVPYDLAGMEPGTKTFLRQRSYTSGPIVEGTPTPADADNDKQVLRYLVHLHICCPARGRYYLYKSIRVVFANRVPDGKERLRNDVTLPEPRFTPYKPVRQMHPPSQSSAGLAAEKAFRRRSSGFSFALPSEEPVSALTSWDARRVRAASVQDRGMGAPGFAPLNFTKGEVASGSAAGGAGMSLSTAEGLLSLRLRGLGMQGALAGDVKEETGESECS